MTDGEHEAGGNDGGDGKIKNAAVEGLGFVFQIADDKRADEAAIVIFGNAGSVEY